ncbi:MAG: hypothetical protein IJV38_05975 [Prevotella sp.]|nr:hypothetical protein [Prevotella sp.]
MVLKKIKFTDGTCIFYKKENGRIHRYIEYALTPSDIKKIKAKPILKKFLESKVKMHNAGKYYYLNVLYGIKLKLNDEQKHLLYNELKELHDKVEQEYDPMIINKGFLSTFGKYWPDNNIQCAAFFTTIYLAMLDLEENKYNYPNALGKSMVLKSCEAVILHNVNPRDAAIMFERKGEAIYDDMP